MPRREPAAAEPSRLRRGPVAAISALTLIGAVALWETSDWSRPLELLVLVVTALVCDIVTVRVGRIHFSASNVAITLAILLFGAVPGMVVAVCAMAFDAARRSTSLAYSVSNLAVHGAVPVVAGSAWLGYESVVAAAPETLGYLLGAALLAIVVDVVNFALVAVTSPSLEGVMVRSSMSEDYLPFMPWAFIQSGLVAGTAHATASFGVAPLIGLAVLLAGGQMTLFSQARANRREEELRKAREERDAARERVAWEVHDDALQVLLAAHQDLAAVREGEDDRLEPAAESLAIGIRQLRMLLRERVAGAETTLEAELRATARRLEAGGVRCEFQVDPVAPSQEPLVTAAVRELVRNAEKHAAASWLRVHVSTERERTAIVVSDDGAGLEAGIAPRRAREGHLGIALLRRRIAKAGGRLHIQSEPERGTTVSITLPAAETAP